MSPHQYSDIFEKRYQQVIDSGASPDQAKDAVLDEIALHCSLLFDKGPESRLREAIRAACDQTWDVAQQAKE